MYYEIYLDVVFIINFILDLFIVKIAGCIAKRKSTLLRCIAAALVSSCTLCVIYIFFMELLVKYFFVMMLIMNLITVIIVFCGRESKVCEIIRILAIYYAVSFMIGGLINMICNNAAIGTGLFMVSWQSVLTVGGVCVLAVKPFVILLERRREKNSVYYAVELSMADKTVMLKGLLDTGNHLVEPVSGKPVQVAELSAVDELFEEEFVCAVKEYYEKGMVVNGLYLKKGIRMVPFRAVGTPEDKLLVAVTADVMRIKNKTSEYTDRNVYIALYDGKLAGDGAYRVLLNSRELIRERG